MNPDPQLLASLMNTGQNSSEQQDIDRQRAMANMLRQRAFQPPPQQMAGRLLLPQFGHNAGSFMAGRAANEQMGQAQQRQTGLDTQRTNARQQYLDRLLMSLRTPYPQQSQPMLPPDGMEDQ